MKLSEILPELTAKFEPHEHKKRQVPGGADWYFVPWQTVRARLNRICPEDWTNIYSDLTFTEGYCIIVCTLTICSVSHQGIGSTPIEMLSQEGKNVAYGDPIERATADAFKNAAEQFGIAAYLDAQSNPMKKKAFVEYVSGRSRAA